MSVQVWYRYSPRIHEALAEYRRDSDPSGRSSSIILTLAEALLRSEKIDQGKISLDGITGKGAYETDRARASKKHHPYLLNLYQSTPRAFRSSVLGETLDAAARFMKERPQECAMLLLNRNALFEDVEDSSYPPVPEGKAVDPKPKSDGSGAFEEGEREGPEKGAETTTLNGLDPNTFDFDQEVF